jgi:hypothetical protein
LPESVLSWERETGDSRLDGGEERSQTAPMQTLKADAKQRVRIPGAKPHQVFAYTNNGQGTFVLTAVSSKTAPRFPRGSLLKYFTAEKNSEELEILKGCVQGPK